MACAANLRGPGLRCLHDRFIDSDRKKHQLILLPFSLKSRFDFRLYPLTGNRMLGEHEQEFVIGPNGLVDAGPNLITNFHVMRSKPAMHTIALKISRKSLSDIPIVAGITNEAGV